MLWPQKIVSKSYLRFVFFELHEKKPKSDIIYSFEIERKDRCLFSSICKHSDLLNSMNII